VRLLHVVGHAGGRRTSSLDAVETELDNVRRSLEQALADDAPDLVARAMWDSWWFWWTRGYVREGKLWSDRCLASPSIDRESRAAGVCARAMLAIWSGEYELAVAGFQEASGLAREFGDVRMSAYADIGLGLVTAVASSVTAGVTLIRRGTTGLEGIRDEEGVASGLAATSWVQGITREFDDSEAFFLEARERAEQVGSDMDLGIIEAALTQYRMSRGETEGVYELIGSSLDHVAGTRHIGSTILTLEIIAELGLAADLPARSLALLQATGAIRSAMGTRVPAQAAARLRQLREVAHERLGHDLHTASAKEPSSPTFADVVDQGRGLLEELSRGTQTVVQGQDTVG
jgi:hypothetical protein